MHLNGVPVTFRSFNQKMASECHSDRCTQCIIHEKHIEIILKLPMLASIDNGGAVDIIGNNWSIGRKTCYMEAKQIFLLELKAAHNKSDMFTKNLAGPEYNKHAAMLCV